MHHSHIVTEFDVDKLSIPSPTVTTSSGFGTEDTTVVVEFKFVRERVKSLAEYLGVCPRQSRVELLRDQVGFSEGSQ